MNDNDLDALWAAVDAQGYVLEIVLAKAFSSMPEQVSTDLKAAIVARRPWWLPAGSGPVDAERAQASSDRMMAGVDRLVGLVSEREAAIRIRVMEDIAGITKLRGVAPKQP